MVAHVCCKLLFSMFHLFFPTYVASVFILMLLMFLHKWCKYFRWILCIFTVVQVFCKCFRRRFQMFNLFSVYVAFGCFQTRSSVVSLSSSFCCLASVLGAGRRRRAPHACGRVQQTWCGWTGVGRGSRGSGASIQTRGLCPDVQMLATPFLDPPK